MSVSRDQQQIIDNLVATFLKTSDATGKLYLKLRQDVIEVCQQIAREVAQNGKPTPELLLRLRKLEVEASHVSVSYDNYLSRLSETLKYAETHPPQFVQKLEKQYTQLKEENEECNLKLKALKEDSAPVVEKMARLTKSFDKGVSALYSARQRNGGDFRSGRHSKPNPNGVLLDYASSVFDRESLEGMFGDIDQKLRELKTVDEIGNDSSKEKTNELRSLDIMKYLDDLLRNNRAYLRVGGDQYSYDISRSTTLNLGTSCSSIDQYNEAIESITDEIRGLVEGGTSAKEKWMNNARKLEAIQTVLKSFEDVEMEDA